MNKEFNFNEVGKRTPFRTPDGFFERMQAETLKRISEEKRKKRLYRLRWGVSVALAVAAMVCGFVFFPAAPKMEPLEHTTGLLATSNAYDAVDLYVQGLSDEELEDWIEFSENDIFYELTTQNLNEDEN